MANSKLISLGVGWAIRILVWGSLVLLLAAVLAPFAKPRRRFSPTNACIAQLKQIQGALEMHGLKNRLKPTNQVSISGISGGTNRLILPLINVDLSCPAGGTYSVTTVEEVPRCSHPGHTIEPAVP